MIQVTRLQRTRHRSNTSATISGSRRPIRPTFPILPRDNRRRSRMSLARARQFDHRQNILVDRIHILNTRTTLLKHVSRRRDHHAPRGTISTLLHVFTTRPSRHQGMTMGTQRRPTRPEPRRQIERALRSPTRSTRHVFSSFTPRDKIHRRHVARLTNINHHQHTINNNGSTIRVLLQRKALKGDTIQAPRNRRRFSLFKHQRDHVISQVRLLHQRVNVFGHPHKAYHHTVTTSSTIFKFVRHRHDPNLLLGRGLQQTRLRTTTTTSTSHVVCSGHVLRRVFRGFSVSLTSVQRATYAPSSSGVSTGSPPPDAATSYEPTGPSFSSGDASPGPAPAESVHETSFSK